MPKLNWFWRGTKPIWNSFLDLVFPKLCQGCGAEGVYFCITCQAKIEIPGGRCLECDKNSFLGRIHPECQSSRWALSGLLVAAGYEQEGVRNLIWNYKYNAVRDIAEIFATLMIDYLVKQDLVDYFAGCAVIPVPLHRTRVRLRGFNQAAVIAQKIAERLQLDYLPIIQRTQNSKSQVALEREERFRNVEGIFSANPVPSLGKKKILLIDDVATTGATLNECAKVLRANNAIEIWGFVVARN